RASKRKLIVALDGTLNQFGLQYSNVVDLYGRIEKNDEQRMYYNSGVGTYATPSPRWWSPHILKRAVGSVVDLAIAWSFHKSILAAYRWLSENYELGSQIFLF
ncbi:hypothetical protein GLOTRDRAFT_18414, partial [Gloeophyllum trabeum ATCC 11539]